jgi:chromosome partitioning protein
MTEAKPKQVKGSRTKRVVAVCSFKGGTAKTSSTLHVGAALATFHRQRVLLIDFDAQANLTTGLGFDPDEQDSLAPVLQGQRPIQDIIRTTCIPNLDLIPADTWLERIEVTEALACDRYSHERLRELVSGLNYDWVLIDTPPSLCWLTESALIAAGHVLVCATPEFYSVKGLERLSQFISTIGKRHPLTILGVAMSFWNNRGRNNSTFVEFIERAFPDKVFSTKIRRDVAISEAAAYGQPAFATAPRSRAAEDYQNLTLELLGRLNG